MTNVVETECILDEQGVPDEETYLDDIGVGLGEKAQDETRFKNIKAEAFWNLRTWILKGGLLVRHPGFQQLTWIKYKVMTDMMIQIEPKADLKRRSGKCPDFAEALMLTFTERPPEPNVRVL